MKAYLFFYISFIHVFLCFSQNTGKGFSYQALARDAMGTIRTNQNIELRFSLLPNQFSEIPHYQETQVATTDSYGTFSVIIGRGIKTAGSVESFKDISFRYTNYWLKIEIKEGSEYVNIVTQQLLSVPYAENTFEMPAGIIVPFGGSESEVPDGWLFCNGSPLSSDDYPALYKAIKTNWGNGSDGVGTNFNLPDLCGMFLRGYSGNNSTRDLDKELRAASKTGGNSGNNVGSIQKDTVMSHSHIYYPVTSIYTSKSGTGSGVFGSQSVPAGGSNSGIETGRDSGVRTLTKLYREPQKLKFFGSSETRPINVYVLYIIKY